MVRKKATGAETATLQIGLKPDENADENEGSQEADEVEAALALLPQGTLGKLYRVEQNGEMAWLENGQPSALNEERAARHGPGKYRVIFNGPNPKKNGRVTYLGSATFVVGESAAAKALAEAKAVEQPNAGPPNGGMSLMDQMASSMFLNMMRQQQEAQAMQSRQQMEHSAAMMALMQKLAERPAMDPILAALLPKLFEKTDPIEQATRIAEINAKGAAKSDIANVLSVMELVERIKGDTPNAGGDASWMGMLKDALPLLLSRQANPAPAASSVAVVPSPNAPQPQPMPNNRPTVEPYLQPLAPFFPRIEEAATAGMEPEIAGDYFLGLIPPGHWPGLAGILDRDSVVPDIVKGYPALAPFQAWLDGLRSALLDGIRGDGDGDEGDEDDGTHGGPRAPK